MAILPSYTTRIASSDRASVERARRLRQSAADLRLRVSSGSYGQKELEEFWFLAENAGIALIASNTELAERAGLGSTFFMSVVRDRRQPKLTNFLKALTAIIETADDRLTDVEKGDRRKPARRTLPQKVAIILPPYNPEADDEGYWQAEVSEALSSLDRDPVSVTIQCSYFRYRDRWDKDELASTFMSLGRSAIDIANPNWGEFNSTLGEAHTHLKAIRQIIHNRRIGEPTGDLDHAISDLGSNLAALWEFAQQPRGPARVRNSRSRAQIKVTEVKRYSTLLITALQEVLDYTPRPGTNRRQPALWLDDANYLQDVAALVAELRRLNALLEAKEPRRAKQSAARFGKHFDTFLGRFSGSFGTALGIGSAGLLIGGAGALLTYAGFGGPIVNQIFSHLKGRH